MWRETSENETMILFHILVTVCQDALVGTPLSVLVQVLFSLLPPAQQPVESIRAALGLGPNLDSPRDQRAFEGRGCVCEALRGGSKTECYPAFL